MYVLHDIEHPERYGGLPKDPRFRCWSASGKDR
jgi:hypothetical protein